VKAKLKLSPTPERVRRLQV